MTFNKNILFREWGEVIVASYSENVMQSTVKLFCSFLDLFFMKLVSQAIVSNIFVFFIFFSYLIWTICICLYYIWMTKIHR